MATAITFDCKQKHTVTLRQGHAVASPAIPGTAGLYLIRNRNNADSVYAGTSSNLKERFKTRLEVYRESGFTEETLAALRIYQVKVKIDDAGRSVDDTGHVLLSGGMWLDAEHLLIRSIVMRARKRSVRNVAKWNVMFVNPLNEQLDIEFDHFPHGVGDWIPANFNLRRYQGF